MITVLYIPSENDAAIEDRRIESGFEGLSELIGGDIEMVLTTFDRIVAYCDENGKLRDLPVNRVATLLAMRLGWKPRNDVLVGPVVFCGINDEGEDTDVPERVKLELAVLAQARSIVDDAVG